MHRDRETPLTVIFSLLMKGHGNVAVMKFLAQRSLLRRVLFYKPSQVIADAFLEASESNPSTNTAELRDISAGKVLVMTFQLRRGGDNLDVTIGVTEIARDFGIKIMERADSTSTDIVDARDFWVFQEPAVETSHILDMNKIALVLSGFDSIITIKQLDGFECFAPLVKLVGNTGHRAFVLLTGPVDVEEAQSNNLGRAGVKVCQDILVKQHLGVSIDIQWGFLATSFAEVGATAIDSCRGRVDKRNTLILTPVEELLGVGEVDVEHFLTVSFGGRGS